MAKRYYNLENETKAFLKACDDSGIVPFTTIKAINDFTILQKSLGRVGRYFYDPYFLDKKVGWYAADYGVLSNIASNTPAVSGDAVARWVDKTSNNAHLQPTTTPTYFDGESVYSIGGNSNMSQTNMSGLKFPMSIICVARQMSFETIKWWWNGTGGTNSWRARTGTGANQDKLGWETPGLDSLTNHRIQLNKKLIFGGTCSTQLGGRLKSIFNNTIFTTDTPLAAINPNSMVFFTRLVNNNESSRVAFNEIIISTEAWNDLQIAQLEFYLKTKWKVEY